VQLRTPGGQIYPDYSIAQLPITKVLSLVQKAQLTQVSARLQ